MERMTALPLTPASANDGRLVCHYFDANRCRSCSLIETPHAQQISDKESWCREILASHAPDLWLPAAFGPDHDFRNRAKLAVGGAAGAVTLGILDHEFHGVDLRECGIQHRRSAPSSPLSPTSSTRPGSTPTTSPLAEVS